MNELQMGMCLTVADAPDALFPTDNDLGIPALDPSMQAHFLTLPFTRWGEISRASIMPGTYHFYTDDYKFNALWRDPTPVVNSECYAAVEPNFSTNDAMPIAVGVYQIYRKRWLARYWQRFGVRVFADLNVSAKFRGINLLGVPLGWRAWLTRGMSKRASLVLEDYELACEHAGTNDVLFVVYGGGQDVYELCKSRGLVWLPENMHVKEGRKWATAAVAEVEAAAVGQEAEQLLQENLEARALSPQQ